jgi:nitrite reductase/ring-hydroxylating ferredoxin subunit
MHPIQFETVSLGGIQPASAAGGALLERIRSGDLIIARKALQALGEFADFRDLALESAGEVAGPAARLKLEHEGFEQIHKILTPAQLFAANQHMANKFQKAGPDLLKKICRHIFGRDAFYFEYFANVRFDIPFDVWVSDREKFREFGARYGDGKLTAHGPHHDSWHKLPNNSINVWMAISSVQPGNGMSVYPQVFGKSLPHSRGDLKIAPNQYYGPAVNFSMEPGDILLFHGEHLHSTELNRVESTRFVVSYRVAFEAPNFVSGRSRFISSRTVGTLRYRLSEWTFKTALGLKRRLPKRWAGKLVSLGGGHGPARAFDDLSQDFPRAAESSDDLAQMPVGAIRPLSAKVCVARVDAQNWVKFSRRCPHEGADLAGGYLRDGKIFCPWHNLSFDVKTGFSPCRSIPAIQAEPVASPQR